MAYVGKNPVFTSTIHPDQVSSLSNPATGNFKLFFLNGELTSRDSSGAEITYGAASAATPDTSGTVTSFAPIVKSSINSVSSADYTITDTDGYDKILVSTAASDRTITLPTAANNTGRSIEILKTDTGVGGVIVDGEGAETLGGKTTVTLYGQYAKLSIFCDGTEWFVTELSMPWQAYTPSTTQGLGTITSRLEYKVSNNTVFIRGDLSVGTVTAAEARVQNPNSWTIDFTTATSQQLIGDAAIDRVSGNIRWLVIGGNAAAYFNFGLRTNGASDNQLTRRDGNAAFASSDRISVLIEFTTNDLPNAG